MKIAGTHEIDASREVVYQALSDPQILQRCIPGCESLELTAENTYLATMKAGIGPVKGKFKGNVRLEDMQPPAHYRMIVDGKGGARVCKRRRRIRSNRAQRRNRDCLPGRNEGWRSNRRSRPANDRSGRENAGLAVLQYAGSGDQGWRVAEANNRELPSALALLSSAPGFSQCDCPPVKIWKPFKRFPFPRHCDHRLKPGVR